MSNEYLLEVKGLKKYFNVSKGWFKDEKQYLRAVDGIDFKVRQGETLGIVGESGCGKSTTANLLVRLLKPTAGEIIFDGENLLKLSSEEMRKKRADIQMVFQDPFSSLNPRMRVKNIIGEGARIHGLATGRDVMDKVADIMTKVGLSKDHMSRFPHEFSGGQRQRIGVARALILNPRLIVCDEAVSALDVSIQAQILNLLSDLQKDFGLTYLFIAHDLGVVKHVSKRVAVMYLGKIAELADKKKLFDNPLHPYTVSLMSAIPEANPEKKKQRILLEGDVPSPINPPTGCRFHPRCPIAKDICSKEEPKLQDIGGGHYVSCFFPGELKRGF